MFDVNDDAKGDYRRVEVLTGPGRRRRWSADEKARIVAETLVPGARVSEVARRWQICSQQVFGWRTRTLRLAAGGRANRPAADARLRSDRDRGHSDCTVTRGVCRCEDRGRACRCCGAGSSGMDDARPIDCGVARGARVGIPIMIHVAAGARVLLATRPIDFRKGAHALAALAQEVLAEDPFSGAVIVYRAKRSDRFKISGLGQQRPGAGLEAIAAGVVPLAADHGRGDEAVAC